MGPVAMATLGFPAQHIVCRLSCLLTQLSALPDWTCHPRPPKCVLAFQTAPPAHPPPRSLPGTACLQRPRTPRGSLPLTAQMAPIFILATVQAPLVSQVSLPGQARGRHCGRGLALTCREAATGPDPRLFPLNWNFSGSKSFSFLQILFQRQS